MQHPAKQRKIPIWPDKHQSFFNLFSTELMPVLFFANFGFRHQIYTRWHQMVMGIKRRGDVPGLRSESIIKASHLHL
jgi:hypothetical protein